MTNQVNLHDVQEMFKVFTILENIKPGDDLSYVWHEIGRASMALRMAIGSRINLPSYGDKGEK